MDERCEHPLLLASRSPRRAWLLREAGYVFEQADPPFADPPQPRVIASSQPEQLALELAREKAWSLRQRVDEGRLVLAADTICIGDDHRLIGQPQDREQARQMVASFAGRTHAVVTGAVLMCLDGKGKRASVDISDTAEVTMGDVDEQDLDRYLDSDEWRGKAGGYNLFDRQEAGWPITVEGDPTTVVGLPMRKLRWTLTELGVEPSV